MLLCNVLLHSGLNLLIETERETERVLILKPALSRLVSRHSIINYSFVSTKLVVHLVGYGVLF